MTHEKNPLTPMLKQYLSIKSQYTDSVLFFRLGDFYEMFFEDAVEASQILDIALTSRGKGESESVPLCGVPYHACQPYIAKLLAAGKKVAICEQVEDPKLAKGIVRREVVRVITPGMVFDEAVLDQTRPNYLVSLAGEKNFSLAYLDISTGEFCAGVVETFETLLDELTKLDPKEILIPQNWEEKKFPKQLSEHLPQTLIHFLAEADYNETVLQLFDGFETVRHRSSEALKTAAALWQYVCYAQKGKPPHVTSLKLHEWNRFLILDEAAAKHLDLVQTMDQNKKGGLLHLIDQTETPMGARKLRRWLLYPLMDVLAIRKRQASIQTLIHSFELQQIFRTHLKKISDLERLVGRVAIGSANARDLKALADSLDAFPELARGLQNSGGLLSENISSLMGFEEVVQKILSTLAEDLPLALKEGGLIRDGVHGELDELRLIRKSGKNYIATLEEKERLASGIGSLKVRFNRVFGYYIEITHTHKDKIPPHYIRKQTLVNAERFITPELKEYEEKVLGAQERIHQIEYELFVGLREEVAEHAAKIQKGADAVALIDSLFSLAKVAEAKRWVCPEINEGDPLHIEEGRHPIVEMFSEERFVPNDLYLDGEANRFLMITGPNMAGKSTVMRQSALIVILAQMGSFVPAAKAKIGVVDRIFTRVGASDRIARGESTFMVEMVEAAHILKEATSKSLVIIDEIGRGTSTYDGVAIAWAVAEHLHNSIKAKTLFATHYHELTDLPQNCSGMKNFHIAVKEWGEQIVFLRKLVPGPTSRSYGVEVAKLAGLPVDVISRAREILQRLENPLTKVPGTNWPNELKLLNIDQMTPLQALEFLAHFKSKL